MKNAGRVQVVLVVAGPRLPDNQEGSTHGSWRMDLALDANWVMPAGIDADRVADLDAQFERFATQACNARRVGIPSLMEVRAVKRMVPHALLDAHLTLARPAAGGGNEPVCLSPAACLPVYPSMRDLAPDGDRCLTSRAKVLRFEGGRRQPGVRLWEFNVREIIFVGTRAYVEERLDAAAEWARGLARDVLGPTELASAADAFTGGSAGSETMARLQRANGLKREVLFRYGGESVAVASIDNHGSHFSRLFDWDEGGRRTSGCVGLGLERWLYAIKRHAIKRRPSHGGG